MRREIPWLGLLSCTAADSYLLWMIVSRSMAGSVQVVGVAAHLMSCVVFVLSLRELVPQVHRGTATALGLLTVFLPALGMMGVAVACLGALRATNREEVNEPWEFVGAPDAPAPRGQRNPEAELANRLADILRSRAPLHVRLEALLTACQMPPRHCVELLKIGMQDQAEEVRLIAFSRLEATRNRLETRISQLRSQLDHVDADVRAELHFRIAESYAELGYLGLVDGEVGRHALRTATEHAMEACRQGMRPCGAAWFLVGRIRLREGKGQEARQAFERALANGMPWSKLVPYLAEAAFLLSDYDASQTWMRQLDESAADYPTLSRLVEFWR